ncbi:MAG: serine--tRNA ligase [Mycoplasma sp.]|nr:serine--tRNA ligase [Mycoplasma sp.]
MLDLKKIINNTNEYKEKLLKRNFDISVIDELVNLGNKRSKIMTELEKLQFKRNTLSKKIGEIKSKGEDVSGILSEVSEVKNEIEIIEKEEREINSEVEKIILNIPNIPSNDTPDGKDEKDNKIIETKDKLGRGKIIQNKNHQEIMQELDILEVERSVKISGTRFVSYKGVGAKLLRALKDFMLDKHISNGYIEYTPPVIVNTKSLIGTGQLPKFSKELFKIEGTDKWLIPTAEVPLTNIYSNEIINLDKTKKITAYTHCFRSEVGSGGKDKKGIIRLHQFNKVELVKFVKPENSQKEFEKLLKDAQSILEDLELPYQTLSLCSGDIGFSANRTIDLEVWMPSENKFKEISSVSHFGDFQARRSKIRFKDKQGKIKFVNTLNGSGIAIDRCIAAIIENNYNKDGTVTIPKVLIPYIKIEKIKK